MGGCRVWVVEGKGLSSQNDSSHKVGYGICFTLV